MNRVSELLEAPDFGPPGPVPAVRRSFFYRALRSGLPSARSVGAERSHRGGFWSSGTGGQLSHTARTERAALAYSLPDSSPCSRQAFGARAVRWRLPRCRLSPLNFLARGACVPARRARPSNPSRRVSRPSFGICTATGKPSAGIGPCGSACLDTPSSSVAWLFWR